MAGAHVCFFRMAEFHHQVVSGYAVPHRVMRDMPANIMQKSRQTRESLRQYLMLLLIIGAR